MEKVKTAFNLRRHLSCIRLVYTSARLRIWGNDAVVAIYGGLGTQEELSEMANYIQQVRRINSRNTWADYVM